MSKRKTGIKNELRAFYADQGLTGKHLRKALRHDMKAVARNIAVQGCGYRSVRSLQTAFGWGSSLEGSDYWGYRACAINHPSRSRSRWAE